MKKVLKKTKKTIKKIVKKEILSKIKSPKKFSRPRKITKVLKLTRSVKNPIIEPRPYFWESQAVFNPAAIYLGGRVHLFYRALGEDGISRIGYASSKDGVNFDERFLWPVYFMENVEEMERHWPYTSPARLSYDRDLYASGGGWGGCEDPRIVLIDGVVYMTFNMFNGWHSMRVAVISIKEENLLNKKWLWENFSYLSKEGDRQKNWVLFPEKINDKFAIFHNPDLGNPARVGIAYVDNLNDSQTPTRATGAPDPHVLPDHVVVWHKRTRSAASPPIKTKDGWLLLYHAMDKDDGDRYKLGALLLDLEDPEKILYRAGSPILEPDEWYENDWKPGIIYANGAVVKDGKLFVYYGGGDKYVGVASIDLSELVNSMKNNNTVKLGKAKLLQLKVN